MYNCWYHGTVIHGLGNGRRFGFPTANTLLTETPDIEKGVYAVFVKLKDSGNDEILKGMLYVGTRPTLHLSELTFEIHILDFDEDIYDMDISFKIQSKIRNEEHFGTTTALIEQLQKDKDMVREVLDKTAI